MNDVNLLARWYALPILTRRALPAALGRLLAVRVALATLGLVRTRKLLTRLTASATGTAKPTAAWQYRAMALQHASGRLPATRCLARSLTLWWWMRACGLSPRLRMGVRTGERAVEGHAWVECDGHLFDETVTGAATWSLLKWNPPD